MLKLPLPNKLNELASRLTKEGNEETLDPRCKLSHYHSATTHPK